MGRSCKHVQPFRAAFYRAPQTDPAANAAPPYDVIGPDDHRELLARSPHNVVRFTLGDRPGEEGDFREAAAALRGLVEAGVVGVDPSPAYYVYRITYRVSGRDRSYLGLVATVDLTGDAVLPHEKTMAGVKEGRLRALEGARANLGLVSLACQDEGGLPALLERGRGQIRVEVTVRPGETHAIHDFSPGLHDELTGLLAPLQLVIADGHHRFQTAQRYRELHPEFEAARRCLVVLSSLASSGLEIRPTHRAIFFSGRDAAAAWARAVIGSLPAAAGNRADLTVHAPGQVNGVPLRFDGRDDSLISYLHAAFLDRLGPEVRFEYRHDISAAIDDVRAGRPVVALRVRAVTPGELLRTVRAGRVFPPKSTFFYPKLYSGLIMRLLDED
jgi:uncharacterized protein (DUF1015 family)